MVVAGAAVVAVVVWKAVELTVLAVAVAAGRLLDRLRGRRATGRAERVPRRHRMGLPPRRPERHDDLVVRREPEARRVGHRSSVGVHAENAPAAGAVAADATAVETDAPDAEDLAERERAHGRRLDVDDPRCVVGVERRDEAALRIDPDAGRHDDAPPVDEDVQVRVDVERRALLGKRRQAQRREPGPDRVPLLAGHGAGPVSSPGSRPESTRGAEAEPASERAASVTPTAAETAAAPIAIATSARRRVSARPRGRRLRLGAPLMAGMVARLGSPPIGRSDDLAGRSPRPNGRRAMLLRRQANRHARPVVGRRGDGHRPARRLDADALGREPDVSVGEPLGRELGREAAPVVLDHEPELVAVLDEPHADPARPRVLGDVAEQLARGREDEHLDARVAVLVAKVELEREAGARRRLLRDGAERRLHARLLEHVRVQLGDRVPQLPHGVHESPVGSLERGMRRRLGDLLELMARREEILERVVVERLGEDPALPLLRLERVGEEARALLCEPAHLLGAPAELEGEEGTGEADPGKETGLCRDEPAASAPTSPGGARPGRRTRS